MTTHHPNSQQTLQRVKVGMIGLAAVVLLIGLASAIFSAASHDRPVAGAGSAPDVVANLTIANTGDPTTARNEPLAELGVAPSAEATTVANAAAPAPAPVLVPPALAPSAPQGPKP